MGRIAALRVTGAGDAEAQAVQAPTVARRAYELIRLKLLRGDYEPGTVLTLRNIAEELKTSVMPVREAISRLGAEAALVVEPNRVIRVPLLTRAEIHDLWTIRIHLEGEAAERVAAMHRDSDVRHLEHASKLIHDAFHAQDVAVMLERIHGYAMQICRLSGSDIITKYVENVRLRLAPHTGTATRSKPLDLDYYSFSLRLQDELIDAVRQGDAAKARELRKLDIQVTRDWVS